MRSATVPPNPKRHRPSPITVAAAALLLTGPILLAFWSGGYFDGPRLVALGGVAVILLALALDPRNDGLLPRSGAGRAALSGSVLLAGWVWLSRVRSPLPDVAGDDAERVLLYAGLLAAGTVVWRRRDLARTVEPAVAAGIVVVLMYGLAGRWLPGIVHLQATLSAGGRLEQPLTYWNATGMLAAVGAVLCIRIAGDFRRHAGVRTAAAAGVVPLLCGIYLSFSRGAVAATIAGLVVLVLCAPSTGQLRVLAVSLSTGAVAVLASALLDGVRALEGSDGAQQRDGLVALGITAAMMAAAAVLTSRAAARAISGSKPERLLRVPPAARWIALVIIVLTIVGPVLVSRDGEGLGRRRAEPAFGANSQRFTSVTSNRYAYWRVAVHGFRDHPVVGGGAGSWATDWLRLRTIDEGARDAHSIELETLAELGLVGLVLLFVTFGGVARCAAKVQRRDPGLAAGLCAGLTVYFVHSALDWDWELPGATLPVLTLAAVVVARAGVEEPAGSVAGVDDTASAARRSCSDYADRA